MYQTRANLVIEYNLVHAAKLKALNAISYSTTGGFSLSRARLQELNDLEKELLEKINAIDSKTSGGMFNRAEFINPS